MIICDRCGATQKASHFSRDDYRTIRAVEIQYRTGVEDGMNIYDKKEVFLCGSCCQILKSAKEAAMNKAEAKFAESIKNIQNL